MSRVCLQSKGNSKTSQKTKHNSNIDPQGTTQIPDAATISALVLLASAGGFLFCYFWKVTRYIALRLEGQQLIFFALGAAVPLLVLSRFLLVHPPLRPPYPFEITTWVSRVWNDLFGQLNTVAGLRTCALAFVLGPTLGLLFTGLSPLALTSNYIMNKYGSELEKFLYYSVRRYQFVAITLDNRKVYIGWPSAMPLPRPFREERALDFRLLPLVSGYRHQDTLKLILTTEYLTAYDQIQDPNTTLDPPLRISDFQITIPIDKVVTANPYSFDLGQELFEIEPPEEVSPAE